MFVATPTFADELRQPRTDNSAVVVNPQSLGSAVSWSAVAAGAAAAAALSLILLMLGVGLGLSSVSPWARDGISAGRLGGATIVWLSLTQLLASAMGGYLAGRLRTKWTELHGDEVYFRDTAHGFLAWAMATLVTAALLTSAIGSIVGGAAQAGATVAGGAAGAAASVAGGSSASARMPARGDSVAMGFFVDALFRRDATAAGSPTASAAGLSEAEERSSSRETAEVNRIFMNLSPTEALPPEDIRYVSQIVAQRTGLAQQDAQARVVDVQARVQSRLRNAETALRDAADKARQASAYAALWLFVSLLIGAFIASLAATYGGRRRDA